MRALALLIVCAVIVGCTPITKCGPGNCSGCCGATGTCEVGGSSAACGSGGLICGTCSLGLNCNLGLCTSAGNTGGGGGSSGGGTGGASGGGLGGGSGGGLGGGAGGGTGGGGSGTPFDTYCSNYTNGVCDLAVRCGVYSATGPCRGVLSQVFQCATTPAMRDGRVVFDANRGADCINMVNTGACDVVDLLSCASVTRGTGSLNAPCYGTTECDSSLYCDLGTTCPGICRPATPLGQTVPPGGSCGPNAYSYGNVCTAYVPVGQSCAATAGVTSDRTCVNNAFCSTIKVCTAKRLAGQACTTSGTECGGILPCTGGVCGPLRALNAPCDSARRCQSGLTCSSSNVCVPAGGLNSPCTMMFVQCLPELICDIPPSSTNGSCQATHTVGQSCTYNGYQCGIFSPGIYCTATSAMPSGVCARKKSVGATCQRAEECTTYTCTNGFCAGCEDPTP